MNNKLTDETLSAWKMEAKISLGETAKDDRDYSHHEAILALVTELQERRKADSENLVKDRQRVIDGLCSVGETVWGIEEYMKKWDAKYLPKKY